MGTKEEQEYIVMFSVNDDSTMHAGPSIFGVIAEDISVRWLHLFFDLVCSSRHIR